MNYKLVLGLCSALLLFSCDMVKRQNTVWDEYDIRTPLPYDSAVQANSAQQLRAYDPYSQPYPYVDNDAYYVVPRIECGIRDLPACGE